VGADLFQRFDALAPGTYTLSFLVENQSTSPAELVFAVQQALGTPASVTLADGTLAVLDLPASSGFIHETLTFTITPQLLTQFTPNELTFSNSYDSDAPPLGGTKNPAGTIINIADVSLTLDLPPTISGTAANQSPGTLHPFGQVVILRPQR